MIENPIDMTARQDYEFVEPGFCFIKWDEHWFALVEFLEKGSMSSVTMSKLGFATQYRTIYVIDRELVSRDLFFEQMRERYPKYLEWLIWNGEL